MLELGKLQPSVHFGQRDGTARFCSVSKIHLETVMCCAKERQSLDNA